MSRKDLLYHLVKLNRWMGISPFSAWRYGGSDIVPLRNLRRRACGVSRGGERPLQLNEQGWERAWSEERGQGARRLAARRR